MSLPAKKVLIVGGGFTGMSVAIALSKLGVGVHIVELDPNWRTDGAGITVSGASLRAIEALGLLPTFKKLGALHEGFEAYSAQGQKIMEIPPLAVQGSNIVGGGGIMRPDFAKAMGEITRKAGVKVTLGQSFESIDDGENTVSVSFTDGSVDTFDLVIGADGLNSSVRNKYFPEVPKPEYTGQGVWRAVIPRFGVDKGMQYLGANAKVGFTPCSDDEMYLYYTESRPLRDRVPEDQQLSYLKGLLEEFTAPLMLKIRDSLTASSVILYRPLEGHLVPRPWYRGRIVMMGDAVHATTPHLASGAGMGHEDAVVFAEEFAKGGDLESMLNRYQDRRWERCRLVVTNSARLGEIEMAGGPWEEHSQLMKVSMAALLATV